MVGVGLACRQPAEAGGNSVYQEQFRCTGCLGQPVQIVAGHRSIQQWSLHFTITGQASTSIGVYEAQFHASDPTCRAAPRASYPDDRSSRGPHGEAQNPLGRINYVH